ncbi:MAG: pantoate--beta-alanine ligase [Candidatus Omnitrophica bacterium]|nr:pantoate--beta-alanine ligase [Candidatus Omnitrophota bacterium]
MAKVFLAIGSNLGNRRKNIQEALALLKANKIKINKISRIIETKPVGGPRQGKFLNAVLQAETVLKPKKLLNTLKNIERQLGRKNTVRFGPRVIDLDILLYDKLRFKTKDLIIPHPRMFEREFVLKPLSEIAPNLVNTNPEMKILRSAKKMQALIKSLKKKNMTIGFVPTMGYLHEGHLSLMRKAKNDCDVSVISIFVNPTQFSPNEDFNKYPRDFKRDDRLARSAGVDIIFYPSLKGMYPDGYFTFVDVEKLGEGLCGVLRPGHFRGVATIVVKLFNIVQPDIAYFGQKDAQQARIIQQMAKDLNQPIKIKVLPIIREPDGLAMSSRNVYLSPKEREDALVLSASLKKAQGMIENRIRSAKLVTAMIKNMISQKKSAKIDYIACVDFETLKPVKKIKKNTLIALAVRIGKTRLIDNIILK